MKAVTARLLLETLLAERPRGPNQSLAPRAVVEADLTAGLPFDF